jgi:hypothetical protein
MEEESLVDFKVMVGKQVRQRGEHEQVATLGSYGNVHSPRFRR